MSFRIGTLWAWTMIGDDDEEGILGFLNGTTWLPLIASDRVRLDEYRSYAELIATAQGKRAVLRRFYGGEVLDTIEPEVAS